METEKDYHIRKLEEAAQAADTAWLIANAREENTIDPNVRSDYRKIQVKAKALKNQILRTIPRIEKEQGNKLDEEE